MAASRIIDLRKLLAERFPQESLPPTGRLVTGLRIFDEKLGGGLTKGALTELTSPPGNAGSATIIASLLQRACGDRSFLALIDGRDSFDPSTSGGIDGSALRHLLWIRCRKVAEAMQAADLLLRDGNFPLVILDLVFNPAEELRKIPQSNWYRLQRLVEPAATVFLVLTSRNMIRSAHWKLALENHWTLSQLEKETPNLQGRLKIRVQRTQPNKWKSDPGIAQAV